MIQSYLKHIAVFLGTAILSASSGCTDFHETYYVGIYKPTAQPSGEEVFNSNPQETQLYKYEISGTSVGSKTQFASGLYDARVVDRLFGEIRPATDSTKASPALTSDEKNSPNKSNSPTDTNETTKATPTTSSWNSSPVAHQQTSSDAVRVVSNASSDPNRRIFVKFGPEGTAVSQSDAERMVIFMSSDPQALTDRISAMVDAQQTQATIAKVISKPHTDEQTSAVQTADDDITAAKSTVAAFLEKISSADSGSDTVNLCTKQLIQTLRPSAERSWGFKC